MENTPYRGRPASSVPAGVSLDTYEKMKVNTQCSRLGGSCKVPCESVVNGEYDVDLDHIVARANGGSNDITNLQWLCSCENRKKYTKPDLIYSGHLYFDNEIDLTKLRKHQLALGYALVHGEYRSMFVDHAPLLNRFMVLAWMVGAGKTLGMLSILFGINHLKKQIAPNARRVKKVLWLVHQRSLVQSLAREIKSELKDHGICDFAPTVVEVTDPAHWSHTADVTVACPQSLWDSDKANSMTEERRAEVLSRFDAIIIDEAQFGIDQYLNIARNAPGAFKFAVTATPMNADGVLFCDMDGGAYRNNFVMFSTFSYEAGRKLGIMKKLFNFDEGVEKHAYIRVEGGEADVMLGAEIQKASNTSIKSLPREIAVVNRAIAVADARSKRTGYPNHVMIRCGNIAKTQALQLAFPDISTAVYSGVKGPKLGDSNHPWMIAVSEPASRKSKRLVFVVDIGQFGINNKYCSIIVWIDPSLSMIEIIQRLGRAVRSALKGEAAENDHATIVWDAAADMPQPGAVDGPFTSALKAALKFIENYDDEMERFVKVLDVKDEVGHHPIAKPAVSIPAADRLAIANILGATPSTGLTLEERRDSVISQYVDSYRPSEREKALVEAYVDELVRLEPGKMPKAIFNLPDCALPTPAVLAEQASDSEFSAAILAKAIESGELSPGLSPEMRAEKVRRVKEGDVLVIYEATEEMRTYQSRIRLIESLTLFDYQKIMLGNKNDVNAGLAPIGGSFAMIVADRLGKACVGRLRNEVFVAASMAVRNAVKRKFQLKSTGRKDCQPFEKQLAHALLDERNKQHIIELACSYFVRDKAEWLPGLAAQNDPSAYDSESWDSAA
jgi:5-methylcytosine-specific restriction endonuclease McrA